MTRKVKRSRLTDQETLIYETESKLDDDRGIEQRHEEEGTARVMQRVDGDPRQVLLQHCFAQPFLGRQHGDSSSNNDSDDDYDSNNCLATQDNQHSCSTLMTTSSFMNRLACPRKSWGSGYLRSSGLHSHWLEMCSKFTTATTDYLTGGRGWEIQVLLLCPSGDKSSCTCKVVRIIWCQDAQF